MTRFSSLAATAMFAALFAAPANAQSISEGAAIADNAERLACFDSYTLRQPAPASPPAAAGFPAAPAAVVPVTPVPATPVPAARTSAAPATVVDEGAASAALALPPGSPLSDDRKTEGLFEVRAIREVGRGQFLVLLANGQAWRQTEGEVRRFPENADGLVAKIVPGLLGSHRLTLRDARRQYARNVLVRRLR